MNFSDLKHCPFCGGEEYFERRRAAGYVTYNMRFDGRETHNEGMYDGLSYEDSGKRWCTDCGCYLGNAKTGRVGVAASKKLNRRCPNE